MAGCDAMSRSTATWRSRSRPWPRSPPPAAPLGRRPQPEDAPLLVGAERVLVPVERRAAKPTSATGQAPRPPSPRSPRPRRRSAASRGASAACRWAWRSARAPRSATRRSACSRSQARGHPRRPHRGHVDGLADRGLLRRGLRARGDRGARAAHRQVLGLREPVLGPHDPALGLFAGDTLLRFIRSYMGSREFGDMDIPFACVAADIETGEEVVLKHGPRRRGDPRLVRPAAHLRAHAALGRWLVDGGLVNPCPRALIADMGADILLAVNLTIPAGERKTRCTSATPAPHGPAL